MAPPVLGNTYCFSSGSVQFLLEFLDLPLLPNLTSNETYLSEFETVAPCSLQLQLQTSLLFNFKQIMPDILVGKIKSKYYK